MRNVVQDVVVYLNTGVPGETLQSAEQQFGKQDLRIFCVKLWSWWARGTLMQSRHPYLSMRGPEGRFREFVTAVPELSELVTFDGNNCHFSEAVGRDEWQAINEFARVNFKPRVCASLRK